MRLLSSLTFLLIILLFSSCNGQNHTTMTDNKTHEYTNDLIDESSPYLLQHAHNPVNWQAWNDESLAQAEKEDKLLLISVGYSACHWCHVMEHESFEDSTVAKWMNENFICIKVDREERPDVDQIYMDACQLIAGNGGWPLNAIALPDGRPIFAGTYFQKDQWLKILQYFAEYYPANKEEAEERATQITAGIAQNDAIQFNLEAPNFTVEDLDETWQNWKQKIDFEEGGRAGAPKFPMPINWQYLLRYHYFSQDKKVLKAVNTTLQKMMMGGIYDHVGGGFARYSVDGVWKVPHFEKMLYDNGQLLSLYAQAYSSTKNPDYLTIVEETTTWLEREMLDKSGGYYSALDADSEGVEGKFYVWDEDELDKILGENSDLLKKYWNVTSNGNWEHHNILFTSKDDSTFCQKNDLDIDNWQAIVVQAKAVLLEARTLRIRPGLDDKILTSWNALLLKGFVDAYKATADEKYLQLALQNANFLTKNMIQDDFQVFRNYKDGKVSINGFLDDYSLTIEAFIALYEVTFDEKWLNLAKNMTDYTITHFHDKNDALFFYTSDLDKALITRKKETSDNVIPASNSSMGKCLFLLGKYYYDKEYTALSEKMLNNMQQYSIQYGAFYSNWAMLNDHFVYEPYEIAIVGKDAAILRVEMQQNFIPNVIYLGGEDEGSLALLEGKLQKGETYIYVCQNKACKMPVKTVEEALKLVE